MSLEEEDQGQDFKEMITTDILDTTEDLIEIDRETGATREMIGGMTGEETGGTGDLMTGGRQDRTDQDRGHASSGWNLASARRREDAGFLIPLSINDQPTSSSPIHPDKEIIQQTHDATQYQPSIPSYSYLMLHDATQYQPCLAAAAYFHVCCNC